ncbi:thiamine pyrophosphate-dependent dehydrogenase E1 component subunit alpha [Dactylosporangium sp. NPDC051484]|uniref:thiamine pyrophosphate-dependent dehydrogenase E1 component subunit alpha n=1 Tax=Dactylosporangium sp. NPDC051484 TaxID=3154942 RepID=UPI0034503444
MTLGTAEDTEGRLGLLRMMHRIRSFESHCERLFRDAKIDGAMHLCAGQEAVAVGVCSVMTDADALSFTYRSHGWALARGISPVSLFAECMGRRSGVSKGRGGSKHIGDWSRRILPSNAIVAAGVPLAAGVALATKSLGEPGISVVAFGDGAVNQGVLHETMTMAALWQLPVLFVCENNQYAELTPTMVMQPVARIADRAAASGIPAVRCDGMDVEAVRSAAREACARIRADGGPVFLEAETYRYSGHMTGDPQKYRTTEEVDRWRTRDAIARLEDRLVEAGVPHGALSEVRESETTAVEAAAIQAALEETPEPAEIWESAPSWSRATR